MKAFLCGSSVMDAGHGDTLESVTQAGELMCQALVVSGFSSHLCA